MYTFFALCIFVTSLYYHARKYSNPSSVSLRYLRVLDIFVAIICYGYMFFFVKNILIQGQLYFYIALVLTIFVFLSSKTLYRNSSTLHSYFHIAIGIVAGVIPLFA
jgi:hypothetical protein